MMTRAKYGQALDPIIKEFFVEDFKNHEWQYEKLFKKKDTTRAYETFGGMSGMSGFQEVQELGEIPTKDPVQWYPVNFVVKKFANGLQVSQEMIDDDQHDVIKDMVKSMSTQASRFIERAHAAIFNYGFSNTVPGPDGLALFHEAHLREDNAANTYFNTFYNEPTIATKQLSLQANDANGALAEAMYIFSKQVDEYGNPIASMADTLIVPQKLASIALSLTKNTVKPGGTNGEMNMNNYNIPTVGMPLNVIVWPYLTSDTAWFLMDSKMHYLTSLWRKQPAMWGPDFDGIHQSHIWTCDFRFALGWIQPRYVFGSQGTDLAISHT